MEMSRRNVLQAPVAVAALAAGPGFAQAQSYPARPITMIVPFPAGGATDTLARFLSERLRASLGQPIIIENVAGAAGSIGVGRAARAAGDGYTLSIGTLTTHALIGGLYPLQFDLVADFEPIAVIAAEPLLIVGRKNLPAADLKELIGWLKANPDTASVGIAGVGAVGHLTAFRSSVRPARAFISCRIAATGRPRRISSPDKSIS
jgi:tripartite-type tricarboxylate transporter receptor subunit TctC